MYMPVKVYSETNAVRNHSKDIASYGKKALIITGRNSSRLNGSLNDVIVKKKKENIGYCVFDSIEENPCVNTIIEARKRGLDNSIDFVIGVGGGSPLDAAKAVAFLLAHTDCSESILYTEGDDASLPLVLIPTTCGTGSEVTPYSVLTLTELQTKKSISHRIFANLALIDGKYLKSAPLSVLRSTALDALSHFIESYINTKADDFSRMNVEAGLRLWAKNISVLEDGIASERQFMEMMNASAMAGMAITQTSTGIPHGLSYSLTVKQNIPHGYAVCYFIPGFLNFACENDRQYILDLIGFKDMISFEKWYMRIFMAGW